MAAPISPHLLSLEEERGFLGQIQQWKSWRIQPFTAIPRSNLIPMFLTHPTPLMFMVSLPRLFLSLYLSRHCSCWSRLCHQSSLFRRTPGVDLIISAILRHFPKRTIVLHIYIYNLILHSAYFPLLWKFSLIKLVPEPDKPLIEPSSYRPISLLPLISKMFEKILMKILLPLLDSPN